LVVWQIAVDEVELAGAIALVTLAHFRFRLNAILAFWIAYILTRPLGASIGDYLSQPKADGGLGLRAINEIEQIAQFEFAACHASEAVKRVLLNVRPGMREFEAASHMQPIGLPLSCHPMLASGKRARLGK
jgi:hypothetical protein